MPGLTAPRSDSGPMARVTVDGRTLRPAQVHAIAHASATVVLDPEGLARVTAAHAALPQILARQPV